MVRKFVVSVLSATVLFATMASFAADKAPETPKLIAEIKIGAGNEAGEYYKTIVPAISKGLEQHGYKATAVVSAGSQENIDKVKSGELQAGLSQLDVAALNMTKDKDPDEELLIMGRITPEALFCAVKKEGKIKSYADLTDTQKTATIKVTVSGEKSGTAKTLEYLMSLDANLQTANKGLELVYTSENIKDELLRLASGNRDMICFVMAPNPENELIKAVSSNKDLTFLSFDREELAKKAKVGELHVYDIMEVPSGSKWGLTTKLKTLVTWVGAVVNVKKADPKLVTALRSTVMKDDLLPNDSLVGKAKTMMKDFIQMFQK
jgi:TRAP-type uncharacterized transport system substrate-binding protein